jgi:hypothetical protein
MKRHVSTRKPGSSSVELSGVSAISSAVSKTAGKASLPKQKKPKKQAAPKSKAPKKNEEPKSYLSSGPDLPPPVDLTKFDSPRQFKVTDKRYPK